MINTVKLLGYYGGDQTHCLSAWQSTTLISDIDNVELPNRIDTIYKETVATKKKSPEELLSYLAKEGHHTPFEKSTLHFQVTADIATHIQFLKHRIGVSINTESARYKELEDKYYIPQDWIGIAGSPQLTGINVEDSPVSTWAQILDGYCTLGHKLYHQACNELTPLLGRKRAKESARYFLPYAKQLDFDVMFNFRSFVHFLSLRSSEHAQEEIHLLADKMLELVKAIDGNPFEKSIAAFNL